MHETVRPVIAELTDGERAHELREDRPLIRPYEKRRMGGEPPATGTSVKPSTASVTAMVSDVAKK